MCLKQILLPRSRSICVKMAFFMKNDPPTQNNKTAIFIKTDFHSWGLPLKRIILKSLQFLYIFGSLKMVDFSAKPLFVSKNACFCWKILPSPLYWWTNNKKHFHWYKCNFSEIFDDFYEILIFLIIEKAVKYTGLSLYELIMKNDL